MFSTNRVPPEVLERPHFKYLPLVSLIIPLVHLIIKVLLAT